ncbi:hypothetical protein C0995_003079 [Termitomyces sp. Mi166|nr:hypothetical protein C0995_003079 [Termitomyces sp. Mi166\
MARACYNPSATIEIFNRSNDLKTHPSKSVRDFSSAPLSSVNYIGLTRSHQELSKHLSELSESHSVHANSTCVGVYNQDLWSFRDLSSSSPD